ncbi:MAG: Mce protein [Sporichthyaceae bacterium]
MTDSETRTDEAPAATGRPARTRLVVPGLSLALVLALAGAGWFGLEARSDTEREDARRAAVAAATGYAVDLTTYDHARLDADFQKVLDNSVGEFRSEYTAASDSLRKFIAQFKAKATGKVLESAVLSGDSERAVVLLFVDQTVANANSKETRIDRSRMRMELEKQDGRWLISGLDLV